jgi:uncharacterized protein YggT (Ycf19 family)
MQLIVLLTGVLEALLLARLVARLLAARPDNLFIEALYRVTQPLVLPLQALDAQQPRFGAVLELSTLVLVVVVPLLGYGLWRLATREGRTNHG